MTVCAEADSVQDGRQAGCGAPMLGVGDHMLAHGDTSLIPSENLTDYCETNKQFICLA